MREILLELKGRDVIQKASKLYNNKYDYSRFQYKSSSAKCEIICPIHGVFSWHL